MVKIVSDEERAARRKHSAAWQRYRSRLTAAERAAFAAADEAMVKALPFLIGVKFRDEVRGRSMSFQWDKATGMSDNEMAAELARAHHRHEAEWMASHPIEADRAVNVAENEREKRARAEAEAAYRAEYDAMYPANHDWPAEIDAMVATAAELAAQARREARRRKRVSVMARARR